MAPPQLLMGDPNVVPRDPFAGDGDRCVTRRPPPSFGTTVSSPPLRVGTIGVTFTPPPPFAGDGDRRVASCVRWGPPFHLHNPFQVMGDHRGHLISAISYWWDRGVTPPPPPPRPPPSTAEAGGVFPLPSPWLWRGPNASTAVGSPIPTLSCPHTHPGGLPSPPHGGGGAPRGVLRVFPSYPLG